MSLTPPKSASRRSLLISAKTVSGLQYETLKDAGTTSALPTAQAGLCLYEALYAGERFLVEHLLEDRFNV